MNDRGRGSARAAGGPGRRAALAALVALAASAGGYATPNAAPPATPVLTAGTFECGPGEDALVLALFVADDGASECRGLGTGGVVVCHNASGDAAEGRCATGCTSLAGAAGCVHARRAEWKDHADRLPVSPHLTIECQGRSYELTPAKSGGSEPECRREEDATGRTTGGECTSRDSDGNEQSDVRADCEKGCEYERRGATCKKR